MNVMDLLAAARAMPATTGTRPATAMVVDTPNVRVLLFRLAPGQAVPPHSSPSTVMLSVLAGEGWILGDGGERFCRAGEVVAYAPNERHGMRAAESELILAATIAPRPGRVAEAAA
ncbi:MAG TPA: cupin domain-containing protein [Gemmatimonadaceae bacterium]|nr:cupin domain-containing protein [Gemmatimonadaceae bacterium]